MDISGNYVIEDEHNISKLYTEMRKNNKYDYEYDSELWLEWEQVGKATYEEGNYCLCGVKIIWCYEMKNIYNGTILGPIGSVCILSAIGYSNECTDCHKRFGKEIKRPNLLRRVQENDWTCNKCKKAKKAEVAKVAVDLALKNKRINNELEKLMYAYEHKLINGKRFIDKDERYFNWAVSVNPTGKLLDFVFYYKTKQNLINSLYTP